MKCCFILYYVTACNWLVKQSIDGHLFFAFLKLPLVQVLLVIDVYNSVSVMKFLALLQTFGATGIQILLTFGSYTPKGPLGKCHLLPKFFNSVSVKRVVAEMVQLYVFDK